MRHLLVISTAVVILCSVQAQESAFCASKAQNPPFKANLEVVKEDSQSQQKQPAKSQSEKLETAAKKPETTKKPSDETPPISSTDPTQKKPLLGGMLKEKIKAAEENPEVVDVLRKSDMTKIGAKTFYKDFAGIRFAKYFTVGQRVEIIQQAKPIDAYVLDAKAIRYLGVNNNGNVRQWDTAGQYRSQITPLFTRAYGTQITMDNPNNSSGQVTQIRYTLDYRDVYREYYPKWPNLGMSKWVQNEVMMIHGMRIPGINWYYTVNLGYRYSEISESNTDANPTKAGFENRHTYLANIALAPSDTFEWFGQFEYFKSRRPLSTFSYSPDHFYARTEFRFKSKDQKTSIVPGLSYSTDLYYPLKNRFEKYEMSLRVGRDFTERLSATTQLMYVLSLRDEPDNTAPEYGTTPRPIKDSAAWIGVENRVSYKFWNDFYYQAGVDLSCGTNMSDFDNWATFLGIEYYKPGLLRANFGWHANYYYNVDDLLNTIGFKVFVFM